MFQNPTWPTLIGVNSDIPLTDFRNWLQWLMFRPGLKWCNAIGWNMSLGSSLYFYKRSVIKYIILSCKIVWFCKILTTQNIIETPRKAMSSTSPRSTLVFLGWQFPVLLSCAVNIYIIDCIFFLIGINTQKILFMLPSMDLNMNLISEGSQ